MSDLDVVVKMPLFLEDGVLDPQTLGDIQTLLHVGIDGNVLPGGEWEEAAFDKRKALVQFLLLGQEDVVQEVRLERAILSLPSSQSQICDRELDVVVTMLSVGGSEDIMVLQLSQRSFVLQFQM